MNITTSQFTHQPNFWRSTLLVIDNSDQDWSLIQEALQVCLPEVISIRVSCAQMALRWLEERSLNYSELPKLILMDLHLPASQNGWELLMQLKEKSSPGRQIPIAVMNSSTRQADVVQAYTLGAASYIEKPTDFANWLAYFRTLRHYWWETVSLPNSSASGNKY